MMRNIFDTHAHYDDEAFDADRHALLAALPAKGVRYVIDCGCSERSCRSAVSLAEQYDFVYAACGIHPEDCEAFGSVDTLRERLLPFLQHPKCVAIGEIGLDYYYDLSPRETQRDVMQKQMALAWEIGAPVAWHIRDAHGEILEIMKAWKNRLTGGIIHCFSGSPGIAREYLKLGYYISFAGPLTFKKAPHLQTAAREVPLDRLLVETDSPYLSPEPKRGRRNEPAHVVYTLAKLAELRGLPVEEMAEITWNNACDLYRIPRD